jgi:hypothetical protein
MYAPYGIYEFKVPNAESLPLQARVMVAALQNNEIGSAGEFDLIVNNLGSYRSG